MIYSWGGSGFKPGTLLKEITTMIAEVNAKPARETSAKQEELLMKDGPWELRSHSSEKFLLKSYIQHYCPVAEQKYYWYSLELIDTICCACQERPPDDLMGLWKLHNMEYIQAGVTH